VKHVLLEQKQTKLWKKMTFFGKQNSDY